MCEKTLFDYVSTFLPILLSALLIIQNFIIDLRNKKLQKEIHNRDIRLRRHDDILSIYSIYYDVMSLLYTSNFVFEVKQGNVNYVMNYYNNLFLMKNNILRKLDIANLLFRHSDSELFEVIETRFKLAVEIINKYLAYINGNFVNTATDSWNKICKLQPLLSPYNYLLLHQNQSILNDFLKMCETDETKELDKLLEQYNEQHSYEKFDIYFEKYLGMEELK